MRDRIRVIAALAGLVAVACNKTRDGHGADAPIGVTLYHSEVDSGATPIAVPEPPDLHPGTDPIALPAPVRMPGGAAGPDGGVAADEGEGDSLAPSEPGELTPRSPAESPPHSNDTE